MELSLLMTGDHLATANCCDLISDAGMVALLESILRSASGTGTTAHPAAQQQQQQQQQHRRSSHAPVSFTEDVVDCCSYLLGRCRDVLRACRATTSGTVRFNLSARLDQDDWA